MADDSQVTILIPHWNRADLLAPLLKQLHAQTYPIHRILVIDNGSTDNSVAVAIAEGADVIRMGSNAGFAAAVNRGIETAATKWIAILNNDVTLPPAWLETLVRAAEASSAWFATGKLLKAADHTVIDGTYDLICSGASAWRGGEGRRDSQHWAQPREIQFAPLTAALFRKTVFDRAGLLDERFGSYLEDVDLGLRCAKLGLKGVFVPEAKAVHQGSATRGAWHTATVRQIARNHIFIICKHFRGAPRWPILVAQLLWWLLAIRHRAGYSYLAGRREGLSRTVDLSAGASPWGDIRETVLQSERDLYSLQQRDGFDWYWRWYFMLTRGGLR